MKEKVKSRIFIFNGIAYKLGKKIGPENMIEPLPEVTLLYVKKESRTKEGPNLLNCKSKRTYSIVEQFKRDLEYWSPLIWIAKMLLASYSLFFTLLFLEELMPPELQQRLLGPQTVMGLLITGFCWLLTGAFCIELSSLFVKARR